MTPKKIFLRGFGCQMNDYDTARLADLMAARGYVRVDEVEDADLAVLMTCDIRAKAREKAFSDLGRWRLIKQRRPGFTIAFGGCVASREGEEILRRAPWVDVVFGPQTMHRLPELLRRRAEGGRPPVDVSFPEIEKFDRLPPPSVDGPTAFVTIMEGCGRFCSYCVVPYTRGREISRPALDVLAECADLAGRGVREITLLGQNVNAWRGRRPGGGEADFADLLELVCGIRGVERVRYTTSHPTEFGPRLVAAHGRLPGLARHVHLPVQSGSDRVLAAMNRGYDRAGYLAIIAALRRACPGLSVSTDFIVGFPGETADDFEDTMSLIEEAGFDASFSFVFSPRPGTPAAELLDDTPREVKLHRLRRLQARIDERAADISRGMLGSEQNCLVTGPAKRGAGMLAARTDNNRVVTFAGPPELVGGMVGLRISEVFPHTLGGELLTERSS